MNTGFGLPSTIVNSNNAMFWPLWMRTSAFSLGEKRKTKLVSAIMVNLEIEMTYQLDKGVIHH